MIDAKTIIQLQSCASLPKSVKLQYDKYFFNLTEITRFLVIKKKLKYSKKSLHEKFHSNSVVIVKLHQVYFNTIDPYNKNSKSVKLHCKNQNILI